MTDDLDGRIDRLTTTISSMLTRLTQSIDHDVAGIKLAYKQLADLLGTKDTAVSKVGTAIAKAEAPAAQSGPLAVQLVKIINGSGEPVPVTVVKDERSAMGGPIPTDIGTAIAKAEAPAATSGGARIAEHPFQPVWSASVMHAGRAVQSGPLDVQLGRATQSGPLGVQLVKVINGSGEPVPVTVLKEERSAVGGAITTGLGAVGSLIGNFVGGIIGGASLPIVIGELIVLVTEILAATPIIKQILTLADSAIGKVKDIIDAVPVILDLGIRIVLAYLEPVINFAAAFVKAAATLIGGLLNGLVALLNELFAKLAPYLSALLSYLIDNVVRPAITPLVKDLARAFVETIASALFGVGLWFVNGLLAVGRYIVSAWHEMVSYQGRVVAEAGRYIAESNFYVITAVLSKIPGIKSYITAAPPPAPFDAGKPDFGTFPDLFGKEMKDAFKSGADLGRSLAETIFGPIPEKKEKEKEKEKKKGEGGNGKVVPSEDGPPALKLHPFRTPAFEPPAFMAPRDSALPELLERTRVKPGEGKSGPSASTTPEPSAPVTFNGGITVNLSVARIDGDSAQTTARMIAENILQEIRRMSEVERFRRGLPTSTVG